MAEYSVVVPAKAFWKSKTMVLNVVLVVLGILTAFLPAVVDQRAVLGLSDKAVAIIGLVVTFLGIVNAALRAITTQPLAMHRNEFKRVK